MIDTTTVHNEYEFIERMREVTVTMTEEDIIKEYIRDTNEIDIKTAQIMLAAILGSFKAVKEKYPELFI